MYVTWFACFELVTESRRQINAYRFILPLKRGRFIEHAEVGDVGKAWRQRLTSLLSCCGRELNGVERHEEICVYVDLRSDSRIPLEQCAC